MGYQGYNNFSELAVDKTEQVMSLGFDVIGFIADHTLGFAIFLIVLFIIYKWLIVPMIEPVDDETEYDLPED